MKPNIWIRQMTWASKYGIWLGKKREQDRILKLLEIGGPIEAIICDYWGHPDFDKDDALMLIEKAIKAGQKYNENEVLLPDEELNNE